MASIVKMISESFLGGVFGASSTIPWNGQTEEVETPDYQLTSDYDGQETYIIGGGALTAVTPNSEANAKTSAQKIQTYRNMQFYTEVDNAIEEVVNDIISSEPGISPISVNLDRLEVSDKIKEKIRDSHEKIMDLLDLNENAYEVIRQFYIDGRRGYQILLHKNPSKGIQKLVCLDSTCLRPVKLVEIDNSKDIQFIKSERSTFLYNSAAASQNGVTSWTFSTNQNRVIEIPSESVAYADSGMFSPTGKIVVGFLEPAVKPANNLRTVEDATVIYSITRAIDKRAFYLDVGDLPKKSAEEYMNRMMNRFKTKLDYNSATGEVDQNRVNISMVEDLWLPRREGVAATEITNLEAGKNMGEVDHVQYMKEKLYDSLKIPRSRLTEGSMINIGGSELAQLTRQEWKFSKYVERIRKRFSKILKQALKTELITTKVVNQTQWDEISQYISFDFNTDSYVKEQQKSELIASRLGLLRDVEPYVGKLYSIYTIKRDFLRMTDDEIEEEEKRIKEEEKGGLYKNFGESPLQLKVEEEQHEQAGFGVKPDPETPESEDEEFKAAGIDDIEETE